MHAQINLTFANALRSILRQDPDIIMIGEMRDGETAQIAVQSALTGHLVLSTLHTNTAAGAVIRLQDMGIERYLITSAVNGVLAQRLVRTLCEHCKEPYMVATEVSEKRVCRAILSRTEPFIVLLVVSSADERAIADVPASTSCSFLTNQCVGPSLTDKMPVH